MELIHESFEFLEFALILIEPLAAEHILYGSDSRDDQSAVGLCDIHEETGGLVVKMAAQGLHPPKDTGPAHRSEDDPVLDFKIPDLPWGKERVVLCFH